MTGAATYVKSVQVSNWDKSEVGGGGTLTVAGGKKVIFEFIFIFNW